MEFKYNLLLSILNEILLVVHDLLLLLVPLPCAPFSGGGPLLTSKAAPRDSEVSFPLFLLPPPLSSPSLRPSLLLTRTLPLYLSLCLSLLRAAPPSLYDQIDHVVVMKS